jgi:hypothetical protein
MGNPRRNIQQHDRTKANDNAQQCVSSTANTGIQEDRMTGDEAAGGYPAASTAPAPQVATPHSRDNHRQTRPAEERADRHAPYANHCRYKGKYYQIYSRVAELTRP